MWFTITWFGMDGKPVKCEILYRDNSRKAWKFIEGRIHLGAQPIDAVGFWFRPSTDAEIIDPDADYGAERIASPHAEDLGVWDDAPEVVETIANPMYVSDR